MPSVKSKLASIPLPHQAQAQPVWRGPEVDGITFSQLSRYLACKERFRLLVVEGLKPAPSFNHRLEFGNMWHVLEERWDGSGEDRRMGLWKHVDNLCRQYPMSRPDIANWAAIAELMFPLYASHWSHHPDILWSARTPLASEYVFDVPYSLPSGRTVRLRGKFDSVDVVGTGKTARVWLQENKTKSDINEEQIRRQLTFDLQTMIYLVALAGSGLTRVNGKAVPVHGVHYNVVRRPRQYQGKRESPDEFYGRLRGIIAEAPERFFMRWDVEVTAHDVEVFRRDCLDPVLENLADDYEWWAWCKDKHDPEYFNGMLRQEQFPHHCPRHFRFPFGIYNPLTEGGSSELDEYIRTRSEVGLQRTTDLFPELKET